MNKPHTHTNTNAGLRSNKFFLLAIIMLLLGNSYGQINPNLNLTPDGVMDNVFDNRGVHYNLSDIMVSDQNAPAINKSTLITCSNSSYFNLYFEPGCGMESTTNPDHIARRAVLCKVFEDVSNFINSPLTSTGKKVNIWVRNINNLNVTNTNGFLGFASGFYNVPSSSTTGGIADNEIWKTIHTGADSFLNTTVPLTPLGASTNQAGFFYHGMVAFNFNDTATPPIPNTPTITWNTNLTATTIPTSTFDLYTVALHEITHALGFSSLIDANGNSKLGPNFKFYNRYDLKLKTSNNLNLLTTSSSCAAGMYNHNFNSALSTNVLHPVPNSCITDVTTCNTAIKFVGSTNVLVYTPNCFEPASSLSHFEDTHFPGCNSASPYGDDNYFVMCNAGNSGIIRRYLKPAERIALCDIGYSVKPTYGSQTGIFNGYYNYGGTASCTGVTVAGTNDGIATNGTYTFIINENTPIVINGASILSNDKFPTTIKNFQCLEDLTATAAFPTTLSVTTGSLATNISFTSGLSGVHLLRYIPYSGTIRGNITYIYIYVQPTVLNPFCNATPNTCNLVGNGDFEENNSYLTQPNNFQFQRACGWNKNNSNFYNQYFLANTVIPSNSPFSLNVPCNTFGYEPDKILNNKAYAGLLVRSNPGSSLTTSGIINTTLATPLLPNTNYQFSFDVSVAEFVPYRFNTLQAFISSTAPVDITGYVIPNDIINTGILLTSPTISYNTDGWETITINFITLATIPNTYKYLYIGGLNNFTSTQGIPPINSISGCNNLFNFFNQDGSMYYIDNVKLVPTSFDLPDTMCKLDTINLNAFLSPSTPLPGTPQGGIFTGPTGITYNSVTGIYSYKPTVQGSLATITYTYTNNLGCVITLSDTISLITPVLPTFNFPTVICQGVTTGLTLPTSSNNIPPITGTWSTLTGGNVTTISNTTSDNYKFTPTLGQCASVKNVAVKVLSPTAFVVNNDTFTTTFTTVALQTLSVKFNDTYNGGPIPNTITNIPYSLVLTGTLPTFTSGNITFNTTTGVFTIDPYTSPGTYTYNYYIQNNCFDTPSPTQPAIVTIIIGSNVSAPPKITFNFCYNSAGANSTTSTAAQTLYDGVTVLGVPASPSNASITSLNIIPFPSSNVQINANGTITIQPNTLPGFYSFYYIVTSGGYPSINILCEILINPPIEAGSDVVYTAINSTLSYNVLSNDFKLICPTGSLPATVGVGGNVILTPLINAFPQFNILTNGLINVGTNISTGSTYYLQYKICDAVYQTLCQTADVYIYVSTSKMNNTENVATTDFTIEKTIINPNPTNNTITIYFNTEVPTGYKIYLYDIVGRLLIEKEIPAKNTEYQLDLSTYPSANYYIKMGNNNATIFHKTLIKM